MGIMSGATAAGNSTGTLATEAAAAGTAFPLLGFIGALLQAQGASQQENAQTEALQYGQGQQSFANNFAQKQFDAQQKNAANNQFDVSQQLGMNGLNFLATQRANADKQRRVSIFHDMLTGGATSVGANPISSIPNGNGGA